MEHQHRQTRQRAGFTLIELMAVLMIISILTYFLVTSVFGGRDAVNQGVAKNRMAMMSALLGEFSDESGDFPQSQLPSDIGTAPNAVNVGAECLYLALCAEGAPGYGKLDKAEELCNTDGDALSKRPKGFQTQDLFEFGDPWQNPIAYIHHRDYEREFRYVSQDTKTGEFSEYSVRAVKNPKTNGFESPTGFQLLSAGSDGRFGTEDDIVNSQIKK